MLGLLTIIGAFLARAFMGPGQSSGAIGTMQGTSVHKIASDTD
jgi:hypothetical protein